MRITYIVLALSLFSVGATAQEYSVPKTEWGVPNFHGVWKHATIMPFERPVDLGEKRVIPKKKLWFWKVRYRRNSKRLMSH